VLGFIRESNGKKNGRISLPGKSAAIVCDGRLTFSADEESESLSYEVPLAEGLVEISGADFAVAISSKDAEAPEHFIRGGLYTLYAHAYVKGIDPSLCSASSRREGETIFENNMHKKIKKIMCDKKIPSSDRGILPIIRESGEAIYVPLCAVADKVRATEKNRQYLISIYKKHISEETENA
jgi:tRNA(Ile)-lysidine synthetase-like protein